MTRHARNCTAGAVYTYHEKKKDAAASGYGTENLRFGKDSVKDFDCCCLSLQPCRNPVVTPEGYLYDKESILEYVVTKKREYTRKLKAYEAQKKKEENQLAELAEAEKRSNVQKFVAKEKSIVSEPMKSFKATPSTSNISNMSNGLQKKLPSFWIPSETPENKEATLSKPDKAIYCPMSGNPLKIKDLIDVKFKEAVDPDDKSSLIVRKERFVCAVTSDILNNSVPVAILKTTGDVVTVECVEKIIKKDWIHPLTNERLKESDILYLQRGGTGYSTTNEKLQGKHARPVLQV